MSTYAHDRSTYAPFTRAAGARRIVLDLGTVVRTQADPAAAIARLALGIMILPHAMQKLFGVFGGYGFAGSMGWYTETLGIPWIIAFAAMLTEFFGGIGLISGFLGRVSALGVGTVMVTAAMMNHLSSGFFMNWDGQLPAGQEGFEFHLLAAALAAVVVVHGSGAFSLDRLYDRS